LLLSRSAPQTGTGKSPSDSAQKTTAVCANWETFGFDYGEAGECTAILAVMVDGIFTMERAQKKPAQLQQRRLSRDDGCAWGRLRRP
jgi:hypothetical protein